jgi:hypothetical protein
MIVNLMTFPIFVVLLFIARMIINLGSNSTQPLWTPPFLINFNTSALQTLVGGFILFSIPDLIKTLKEATGIKPMPINLGLGSLFTGATSAVGGGVGMLGQISSVSLGLNAITGKGIHDLFSGKHETPPPHPGVSGAIQEQTNNPNPLGQSQTGRG